MTSADLEEKPQTISVQPLISYPHHARVGQTYVMTVNLRFDSGDDGLPDDEHILSVQLKTMPLFSHVPVGRPSLILTPFGGTIAPVQFHLTAKQETHEGRIEVLFFNRYLMLVGQVVLDGIYIEAPNHSPRFAFSFDELQQETVAHCQQAIEEIKQLIERLIQDETEALKDYERAERRRQLRALELARIAKDKATANINTSKAFHVQLQFIEARLTIPDYESALELGSILLKDLQDSASSFDDHVLIAVIESSVNALVETIQTTSEAALDKVNEAFKHNDQSADQAEKFLSDTFLKYFPGSDKAERLRKNRLVAKITAALDQDAKASQTAEERVTAVQQGFWSTNTTAYPLAQVVEQAMRPMSDGLLRAQQLLTDQLSPEEDFAGLQQRWNEHYLQYWITRLRASIYTSDPNEFGVQLAEAEQAAPNEAIRSLLVDSPKIIDLKTECSARDFFQQGQIAFDEGHWDDAQEALAIADSEAQKIALPQERISELTKRLRTVRTLRDGLPKLLNDTDDLLDQLRKRAVAELFHDDLFDRINASIGQSNHHITLHAQLKTDNLPHYKRVVDRYMENWQRFARHEQSAWPLEPKGINDNDLVEHIDHLVRLAPLPEWCDDLDDLQPGLSQIAALKRELQGLSQLSTVRVALRIGNIPTADTAILEATKLLGSDQRITVIQKERDARKEQIETDLTALYTGFAQLRNVLEGNDEPDWATFAKQHDQLMSDSIALDADAPDIMLSGPRTIQEALRMLNAYRESYTALEALLITSRSERKGDWPNQCELLRNRLGELSDSLAALGEVPPLDSGTRVARPSTRYLHTTVAESLQRIHRIYEATILLDPSF